MQYRDMVPGGFGNFLVAGGATEGIEIVGPAAGSWWIAVQNFASGRIEDSLPCTTASSPPLTPIATRFRLRPK